MEGLGPKLAARKQASTRQAKQTRALQESVMQNLTGFFSTNTIERQLKGFSLRQHKLTLETNTKSFANALFLRREELLKQLAPRLGIREVVIK